MSQNTARRLRAFAVEENRCKTRDISYRYKDPYEGKYWLTDTGDPAMKEDYETPVKLAYWMRTAQTVLSPLELT